MNKILLAEDDCAPDAREYFDKDLEERYGLTVNEIQQKGVAATPPEGYCNESYMGWIYKGYLLESFCDDPFLRLLKLEEQDDEICQGCEKWKTCENRGHSTHTEGCS